MIATVCRSGLRTLSAILYRFCRSVWARPKLTLVLLAAITAISTYNLSRIKFLFSAQDMVGEGIASADELSEIRDRYQDGTSSTLLVLPPEGQFSFSPRDLCEIRKWYAITRVTSPEFKNTLSTFDLIWPVRVDANHVKYQNLLQLDCAQSDPTIDLKKAKTTIDDSPWLALKDRNHRLSLVFSFTYRDIEGSNFGTFDPRIVSHIRETVETDLRAIIPGARLHWVGLADYQWFVRKGFQFTIVVNTAMTLLLLISLRLLYGTWLSGLFFCATLVINGIWIYGLKAVFGSPYDVLASGLFLILGVSAIEDFTFLSSEQLRGASWKKATRKLLVPSFFTSLTTIIGFASLCTSDLAIIRRFGVWCAFGALLEWLMLFVFLPILLKRYYSKDRWVNTARAHASASDRLSVASPPRWISRLCLLVFPLALLSLQHLDVDDNPAAVFPARHPYNLGLQELKDSKGWLGSASLIWDGPSPQNLDLAATALQKNHVIAGFESADRILDWLAAPQVLSRKTIFSDFKTTQTYHQLVDSAGVPRATLYLDRTSVRDIQSLEAEVAKVCPEHQCHAAGDLVAYSDFSTFVPKTLIESMVLSLFLVALVIAILCLAFGQQRYFLHLIISSFWGPCLMLIALVVLRIPMNFMNSIIASVLVGLTGDNAVQYLFAAGSGNLKSGISRRGGASILTNLLMALTALMYLLSYFNPPKTFGLILAGGLVVTLIGDLWLLNGLLGRETDPAPQT